MAKAASPKPSPSDQKAAHAFLSELRTRITTQPLPYQYGVEARALESLWEVFAQAREAMKKHPGCEAFAREVTEALNVDLRPMTAKWHRAHSEGRLASRDGGNEFRSDLADVQEKLRASPAVCTRWPIAVVHRRPQSAAAVGGRARRMFRGSAFRYRQG